MRTFALVVASFAALPVEAVPAAPLDGVTIFDVSSSNVGEVLFGRTILGETWLTTYVSPQGAYASLTDSRRVCRAPATSGSAEDGRMSFGLPADELTIRLAYPQICQPFTITLLENGKATIEARNNLFDSEGGPLAVGVETLSYTGTHDVVVRAPLGAVDWPKVVDAGLDVLGATLGPVDLLSDREPPIGFHPRGRDLGDIHPVWVTVEGVPNPAAAKGIPGTLATVAEDVAPSDVLYQMVAERYYSTDILTNVFEEAAIEQFGPATRHDPLTARSAMQYLFWMLDLNGEVVGPENLSADNCLSTMEFWVAKDLDEMRGDMGPWNCSLFLELAHNGFAGTVSHQRIELTSGYVLGAIHFKKRLKELEEALKEIEASRGFVPKL